MLKFKSRTHQFNFFNLIDKTNCIADKERYSLFYLLTLNDDIFNHINDLYNFETKCIKLSGLDCDWQTSGTVALTKIAFHLFNSNNELNLVQELSRITAPDFNFLIEAIKIRFDF